MRLPFDEEIGQACAPIFDAIDEIRLSLDTAATRFRIWRYRRWLRRHCLVASVEEAGRMGGHDFPRAWRKGISR